VAASPNDGLPEGKIRQQQESTLKHALTTSSVGGTNTQRQDDDWGAHHVDIAMWALAWTIAADLVEGLPSILSPMKTDAQPSNRYNVATSFNGGLQVPDGAELNIRDDTDNGVLIEVTEGSIRQPWRIEGAHGRRTRHNPLSEEPAEEVCTKAKKPKGAATLHMETSSIA